MNKRSVLGLVWFGSGWFQRLLRCSAYWELAFPTSNYELASFQYKTAHSPETGCVHCVTGVSNMGNQWEVDGVSEHLSIGAPEYRR